MNILSYSFMHAGQMAGPRALGKKKKLLTVYGEYGFVEASLIEDGADSGVPGCEGGMDHLQDAFVDLDLD